MLYIFSQTLSTNEIIKRILKPSLIELSNDISLEIISKTKLLYKEKERKLSIEAEIVVDPNGFTIREKIILKWNSTNKDEIIDLNKRNIIRKTK